MGFVWCDGEFLPVDAFRVSPFDRGLCHGMSVFETILAVDGHPRLLDEHLDRLRSGLERLAVTGVEISGDGLRKAMAELLERNGLFRGMARLRLAVSLGVGPLNLSDNGAAWAWMTATPVEDMPDTVRVAAAPWRRDRGSVLRGLKVGNYAEHLMAMDMARSEGFGEMLFFNTDNELCEAAMANVFLIRSGGLLTPGLDSGCLAGVARAAVMRFAAAHGIPCREMPLSHADVEKADGMFLTSSIRGPVRVTEYDGRRFEEHPLFDAIRAIWLGELAP